MKKFWKRFLPAKKNPGKTPKAVLSPAERKRQKAISLLEKAGNEQNPIKFLLENNLDAVALREMNLDAKTLKENFGLNALNFRGLGFSAKELLEAGFAPLSLALARFPASELKEADISIRQVIGAGKKILLGIGYTQKEISGWVPKEQ